MSKSEFRIIAHSVVVSIAVACILSSTALAQNAEATRVQLDGTERRHIKSKNTAHDYELLISLPADYATSGKAYPVLYVLDGWHFPLMVFLQNNSRFSGRMPPVIIVNISQGEGNSAMMRRAIDFTPTPQPDIPGSGGAAAFLKFIGDELVPWVEHTYRTIPSDRALLGHSYGGLFAIYALEQRPELFQRIVAASPTLDWDHDLLITRASATLKSLSAPVRLDLSVGTEDDTTASTDAFVQRLYTIKPKGLTFRSSVFPGENHNSVRLLAFPSALRWVYADR